MSLPSVAITAALALSAAGGAPTAEPGAPMAELVVEGQHEGPRMWSVRSGEHTLWILGTISPLPKKMVWQPDAVEEALKQTQEVVPACTRAASSSPSSKASSRTSPFESTHALSLIHI